jgi:hypothetical protein
LYPKIEKLECNIENYLAEQIKKIAETQNEINQLKNITMQEIRLNIRASSCHRLEEGLEHLIDAIKEICYRGKIRYIIKFVNNEKFYITNYWLEMEIEDLTLDLVYKIKIKIAKI